MLHTSRLKKKDGILQGRFFEFGRRGSAGQGKGVVLGHFLAFSQGTPPPLEDYG
jgi:hypothetical protein